MINNKRGWILLVLMAAAVFVQAGTLTLLHGTKGQADRELKALEKRFPEAGFTVAAKNEHLEMHYFNQFKDKNLDLLNFYRIYNRKGMRELLLRNPDYAAFTPFNFLAFKKLDSMEGGDKTWYGHLDGDTMLDIIGEKDMATREKFKGMLTKLDDLVLEQMKPKYKKRLTFDRPLPAQPLLKMVKKIEDTDDIDGFVESFIMKHDSLFTERHFVIAGFLDLKFEYEDLDLDFGKYDAFWVSSLCHFKFSNAVFNHGEPQAGVFAPCSIYFYIPKDSDELHVGYAMVENWLTTTGIEDEAQLLYMKKVADQVRETFEALGFTVEREGGRETEKRIDGVGKEALKGTEALSGEIAGLKTAINSLTKEIEALRRDLSSIPAAKKESEKTLPSAEVTVKRKFTTAKVVIGGPIPEKLSASYVAQPQSLDSLVGKLKAQGFEILAITDILEGKTVVTVTNEKLKSTNTFMAALNILLDAGSEIRLQNPSYLGAAYLGEHYRYGMFDDVLQALQGALGEMHLTEDLLPYSRLKNFSFKPGMPKFSDFVELADGKNLLDKLKGEKAKKYIAYRLKLPNGATLVGHKMRPHINKFLLKIDEAKNAEILPSQSIVRDGLAYMLDPTYYLALSLPLLSMEEFMKIASTPDEIAKSIGRLYR